MNLIVFVLAVVAGVVLSRVVRRGGRAADGGRPARRGTPTGPPPARDRPVRPATAAPASTATSGRRGLTPTELQRALFAEMLRAVRVGPHGPTVPGRFDVHLHPDDVDLVETHRSWFIRGLFDRLGGLARSEGWTVEGEWEIRPIADPGCRPGLPRLELPTPTAVSTDGATAVRLATGSVHRLDPAGTVIGREDAADIVVDDRRVSRRHARITRSERGWFIIDLGSANGSTVRNEPLHANHPAALRDGTTFGIGPVAFEFREGGTAASGPALDDRRRIDLTVRSFTGGASR